VVAALRVPSFVAGTLLLFGLRGSARSATAPEGGKKTELTRMDVVMKSFTLCKAIEMVLLVVGIGLIAFFQRSDTAAANWCRVGAAISLHAGTGRVCRGQRRGPPEGIDSRFRLGLNRGIAWVSPQRSNLAA